MLVILNSYIWLPYLLHTLGYREYRVFIRIDTYCYQLEALVQHCHQQLGEHNHNHHVVRAHNDSSHKGLQFFSVAESCDKDCHMC